MGVHFPDQHFGVVDGGELLPADACEAQGIAFGQRSGIFELDLTAGDEEVDVRRVGDDDGVAGCEPGA